MEEPHHRVLHPPHVPSLAAPERVGIVADVAVLLLRGEHADDSALDFSGKLVTDFALAIRRVPGVGRSGMHPLAPELGLPPSLSLGLLHERRSDVVGVRPRDVRANHPVEALAERTLQAHLSDVVERIAGCCESECGAERRDGYGSHHNQPFL